MDTLYVFYIEHSRTILRVLCVLATIAMAVLTWAWHASKGKDNYDKYDVYLGVGLTAVLAGMTLWVFLNA